MVEGVLMGHDRRLKVDQHTLGLVNDMTKFNTFCWGRRVLKQTLLSLRSCKPAKYRSTRSYNIGGWPLALQVRPFQFVILWCLVDKFCVCLQVLLICCCRFMFA